MTQQRVACRESPQSCWFVSRAFFGLPARAFLGSPVTILEEGTLSLVFGLVTEKGNLRAKTKKGRVPLGLARFSLPWRRRIRFLDCR